jgi:PAS domain S-box-containing protein
MNTSLKEYIETLHKVSVSGTVEFVLIHMHGDLKVVASSKPLEKLFADIKTAKQFLNLLNTHNIKNEIQTLSEKGSGTAFCEPALFPAALFEIDYIIVYSNLAGYVSFLFWKKHPVTSEILFSEFISDTNLFFFIYHIKDKKLHNISPSVKQILGYGKEHMIKKSIDILLDLIHPDDRKKIKKLSPLKEFKDLKDSHHLLELRVRDSQGAYHFMQFYLLISEDFNKHNKLLGLGQDITTLRNTEHLSNELKNHLKKSEQELKASNKKLNVLQSKLERHNEEMAATHDRLSASEEMLRQFAENTNDIIWLRDEKEILYINDQFEKIWGRNKQEFIENPYKITEWIHPDDISNVEPWVNMENLTQGIPFVEQYRIVRPDGEIRWIWSRIMPVMNQLGKSYRLVGIASDITDQKEFEETLRAAKEKAQESDMLKSTFLANISHEIRTPMNGIVGFAELISREDIDQQTRNNYVSIMKKSSDQLICIIDDIIDFAKLEANQIRILQEVLDINKLLEELYIFYDNQLKKKQIDTVTLLYEKALEGNRSRIISDENRLRQVLSYLLDNAIKFTLTGFVKFGYRLVDEKIEFYVQDSGIGIPVDKHQHIFERFRQVDEGHTRKYGGTGLGLPISKGLVNLLGGQIWLESRPDNGSTFFFTIPYRVETTIEKESQKVVSEKQKYFWKDKVILIAEDDELNFEYIKVLLEPTEAKLVRAKDGSQVIKICSNLNFDLILMDIRLPVLNGIQATKQLREMGIHTPIIAQTAFAMDDDEKRCLSAGCNCYISKPISKDKLFNLINQLI